MSDPLHETAAALGVIPGWRDQLGRWQEASDETLHAILAAMGVDDDAPLNAAEVPPEPVICVPGAVPGLAARRGAGGWCWRRAGPRRAGRRRAGGRCRRCRSGATGSRPTQGTTWVLCAPPSLPRPARGWGLTAPLYGLRGPGGGLGDYRDLLEAVRGLGALGAGFVGINPIHAGFTADPGAISPYSPSHRRRFATQHIHVPGERRAPGGDLIDYQSEVPARLAALRRRFEEAGSDPRLDGYIAEGGLGLERFASYEALAERHGPRWDQWPEALRDRDSPAVAAFLRDNPAAVRFHAWLQFLAEDQLSEVARAAQDAGMAQGLYLDMAVGTHPHGAETWADPRSFARGASLGAPPDAFSKDGQVWGVAPFNPRALARTGFAALADTLRAQLRHAHMLRIDHILGFERAFWVPEGLPGTYVRMPREAMLAVIRIEATRAGAVVVGEDLGNVPEGLEEALSASGILGCRVIMFEGARPADDYPEAVLASWGTHDLPTFLGWRGASDIAAREATVGMLNGDALREVRAAEVEAMEAVIGPDPSVDDMHAFLGATASSLVALQAEDVLEVAEQPNLPGTSDEYPNWRRPLPVDAAALGAHPGLRRAAEIMAAAGRGAPEGRVESDAE